MQILKMIALTALLSVFAFNVNAELKAIDVICDEWPPYQIVENNHLNGFSTKIVETVFERMKIEIKGIDVYPWKRAMVMLEKGKVDALLSATFTEDRAKFAFYPEEALVRSPWVMWVREEDDFKFDSFDDLIGKKVGLVRGYSYTPEFWNFVKKHNIYEEVSSDDQNFKKLNGGRVDFVIAEWGNGLYLLKKLGLSRIIPLRDNPLKIDELYIVFNKNNVPRSFVDKFSDELKKLKQESLYKFLYDEYFKF